MVLRKGSYIQYNIEARKSGGPVQKTELRWDNVPEKELLPIQKGTLAYQIKKPRVSPVPKNLTTPTLSRPTG